ncbi:LPXTG cell wall anchor domain-containing protein [Arthrobacter sp. HLT1-20]
MQAFTRAHLKRGGAACAAAAVLIGGTFTAGAASAAPTPAPAPTQSTVATAAATEAPATAPEVATTSGASLPGGLAEAIQRDLGMSLDEFNAKGALAAKASAIATDVAKADPSAVVSIAGDTVRVQTSATARAKAAAGSTKVTVTTVNTSTLSGKASGVDALFADYVSTFGAENLLSVTLNASGEYTIRTAEAQKGLPVAAARSFAASLQPSIADFEAKYANVTVEGASGPAKPSFTEGDPFDVVNGQGYAAINAPAQKAQLCSTGWNGFNKAGQSAIVSAGHCTMDGLLNDVYLTNPLFDKGATGDAASQPRPLTKLGLMGFSQFGGPGNSSAILNPANGNPTGNIGTDVSVVDSITANFTQAAKVAKWTGGASWTAPEQVSTDPTNIVVTGVASPVLNAPVCKSGRTTGWTCGQVDEIGAYAVAGTNYPSEQNPNGDLTDIRAVRGFASITDAMMNDHGDSGGPIISGNTAVGITSAGGKLGNGKFLAIGADLKTALAATDGYTVKIFLQAPQVTTSAPVLRKGKVTGTVAGAPAGTLVVVTIDGVPEDAIVGADGTWSVTAPNKFGTFPVTAHAKNGFSTSATSESSIQVIKETLAAPAITSPADGSSVGAPVTTITGTGTPGATIELSGDVTGSAVVGANGKWSFTLTQGLDDVGFYDVAAQQTLTDWNDSPSTTSSFTISPAAPSVTSPRNGQTFAFNQGPRVISGTNLAQAQVQVSVNGHSYTAVVDGTTWTVTLPNKLTSGNYSITALQQWGDFRSVTTTSALTVLAEPTPPATQKPTAAPTTAAATTAPATQKATTAPSMAPVNTDDLANTGASSSLMILGGAGVLLLLGGAAFLLIRRRNAR